MNSLGKALELAKIIEDISKCLRMIFVIEVRSDATHQVFCQCTARRGQIETTERFNRFPHLWSDCISGKE